MPIFSGNIVNPSTISSQPQNTAAVVEFRCLFTADLRRKQKRWQDGKLKFHTHNNRVMVYDERANYVGDSHWREDYALAEGEELQLERGGVIVEVQECTGKTDQDLTELVDKRIKDKQERAAAKAGQGTPLRPQATPNRFDLTPAANPHSKTLNALLTPSGHYGRAIAPIISPFEERRAMQSDVSEGKENERPMKRQRTNETTSRKNGYAQNLTGATLNLSSTIPQSTVPIRYENLRPKILARPKHVDLTISDDENGKSRNGQREGLPNQQENAKAKNKRSPPTKSRYASNLTGTALTLSTPSVRNERETQLPQARRPPPVTLDDSSSEEDRQVDSNPKVNLAQSRKQASEPGTSSDEEAQPRKKRNKSRQADKPHHRTEAQLHQVTSPSSDSEDPRPKTSKSSEVSKSRAGSNRIPTLAGKSSDIPSRPSSTPSEREHRPTSHKQKNPVSGTGTSAPDQPVSTLRIKSRPRGMMMMLLDRPRSRTPSLTSQIHHPQPQPSPARKRKEGNERSVEQIKRKQVGRKTDMVMSQATAQLHNFCADQEAKLQARLNKGKKSRMRVTLNDLDDEAEVGNPDNRRMSAGIEKQVSDDVERSTARNMRNVTVSSSSPPSTDKGIDHHEIDAILSRKPSTTTSGTNGRALTVPDLVQIPDSDLSVIVNKSANIQPSSRTTKKHNNTRTSPSTNTPSSNDNPAGNPIEECRQITTTIPATNDSTLTTFSIDDAIPSFKIFNRANDASLRSPSPSRVVVGSVLGQPSVSNLFSQKKGTDASLVDLDGDVLMDENHYGKDERDEEEEGASRSSSLMERRGANAEFHEEENTQDDQMAEVSPSRHNLSGPTAHTVTKQRDIHNPQEKNMDHQVEKSPSPSPSPSPSQTHIPPRERTRSSPINQNRLIGAINSDSRSNAKCTTKISQPPERARQHQHQRSDIPFSEVSQSQSPSMPDFLLPLASGKFGTGTGMQSATKQFKAILASSTAAAVNGDGEIDGERHGDGDSDNEGQKDSRKTNLPIQLPLPLPLPLPRHESDEEGEEGERDKNPLLFESSLQEEVIIKASPGSTPLVSLKSVDDNIEKGGNEVPSIDILGQSGHQSNRGVDEEEEESGPGQSTLEMAEVTSTIDMADIPVALLPAVATTATVQPRRPNPATTKGFSLSALAASTLNAPPIDSCLPFTASSSSAGMPPPPGQLHANQNQINKQHVPSLLENFNESLHHPTTTVNVHPVGINGMMGRVVVGVQNLEHANSALWSNSLTATLSKRVYPQRSNKNLQEHKTTRPQQCGDPTGSSLLWLGGGGSCKTATVQDSDAAINDGGQSSAARREDGKGILLGPWSREAFDLFGEWLRPVE